MTQGGTSETSASTQSALADVGDWLYYGYFVPGEYVSSVVSTHAPRVAQFLGLGVVDGVASGVISAVVWLGVIVLSVATYRLIRHLDRTLTAFVDGLYQGLLRTGRTVTRRLGIALRFFALRRQARLARAEAPQQVALTALEFAVLQSHARLAPGHLFTARDIASALKLRSGLVEKALGRLAALSLIHRTFGAGDGEDGYRLTRPGELFLAAHSRVH